MAHLRDLLTDNNLDSIMGSSSAACTDLISPSPQVLDLLHSSLAVVPDNEDLEEVKAKTDVPHSFARGPKKTTSAANFFNKVATKKAKPSSTREDEKENLASKTAKADVGTRKGETDAVGNADDFVGDMEEDDDEDAMDVTPVDAVDDVIPVRAPVAKPRSKKNQRDAPRDDPMDDDNGDDKLIVTGAMDQFAKATEKKEDVTKRKRRRKKMETKTTMDASGYLHTETIEVWEDIPSDEDEKESSIIAQKSHLLGTSNAKNVAVAKANMKQGNLMGFFTKK
jgi:hypothetical protein